MTNEDIQKQQDLKNVSAGQVPFPVSAAPNSGQDAGSTPDPAVQQDISKDLSGAVGGNVAFPVSQSTAGVGQPSGGGVTPDSGAGRPSIDDLATAVGGNIAHPVSIGPAGGQGSGPGQNPNPGPGLGVEDLEGTTAGTAAVQQTGAGGPPSATPDPIFNPPPQDLGGGTDISQGGDSASQSG